MPSCRQRLLCAALVLLFVFALFAAMCALSGVDAGAYPYPSYLLQAQAWLRGELALDRNYEYLELAVYEGRYYVSFPPVPTIPMLLWTLLWGDDVPGGLFQKIYVALACLAVLHTLQRREGALCRDNVCWTLFLCLGSAMLPIALVGGVWYEAQILAFLLSVCAVSAMQGDHPTLSCLCYALAVGCRPFSVCLGPALLVLYLHRTEGKAAKERGRRLLPGLAVGLTVAAAYAVFNYVRFGNPLEFGHSYLPEFQRAEQGQFSLSYIRDNWFTLFFGPPFHIEDGKPVLEQFGFSMFLSCPILFCALVWVLRDLLRHRFSRGKAVVVLMGVLNVFLLLMHRTLGAHQFGLRYALELVPLCFVYLLLRPEGRRMEGWEAAAMLFGLAFNFIGGVRVHV